MSHSDAPMLTNDDFGQDDNTPSGSGDPSQLYMQYQIHFAKLSLILRRIVNTRFNIGLDSTTPETLRDLLVQWRGDVPPSINWPAYGVSPSIFAECLKILYHHQLILIYLPRGDSPNLSAAGLAEMDAPTSEIAESAAQTIASTSLSLMTRSMVHSLPQEVFPAFFVAGIVFFRLIRRSQPLIAQLGQAALDNCQIILHEVRDCWEPAFWGMRIFEFLLAGLNNNASSDTATAEGQDIITSLGKGAELGTEQLIENSASTHDSFALHNTFEMGPAIHNLRKAAQQDTALTTQLFDRFLDPANYLIMPTSLGDQEPFDFEMAEW
jgi:hypothetical protein